MPDPIPLVTFACPWCGRQLRAAGSLAGRVTVCPHCERPLTVPRESEAERPSTAERAIEPTAVTKYPPPRTPS